MAKFSYNKNANISRVVGKVFATTIALYVGGTVLSELGTIMECTQSPFYDGLSLIGWTVGDAVVPHTSGLCNATAGAVTSTTASYDNLITATTGSGILAVVGIIGIASIILEFVNFKM